MRHPLPRLLALLTASLAVAGPASAQSVAATIDQAVRIAFPAAVRDVVVGNPAIADITLLDGRTAVVLGRSFGVTSLTAFDAAGRTVFDRQIVVGSGDANQMALYRGAEINHYACAPRCERTPMPGEPESAYKKFEEPYGAYYDRSKKPSGDGSR
ncbi:pilus assembly protein N-terminal domain-containing protein [Caulobacter sp. NIBR2454]|uniref:pilus assembly protein N-terminal domain-containing protein n=1 Tax=Caulobacter sp. NIBR2454 TaxID=3015996 RepID=UPI0022B69FD0|nr:pilus assembly protein N-terminal domain-containing protein [Caulobacter sp. NIBR2454]